MNNLRISLAEVSECASSIRTLNAQMYDLLIRMKADMNETGGTWISEGGERIRARFNQFASRFETQKEIIDSYARFLDLTVSSYDSLETAISSNAETIQY
ncbi:MAG: pore-forming ESAT-6 family protein [Solobacterium sp.]|nr:WXG100 family type VII secretion target [Erysipelotrichaceae bacterium]MBQ9153942.1 pore-forming ESAT-6 family protein [Solobacterium sp.]